MGADADVVFERGSGSAMDRSVHPDLCLLSTLLGSLVALQYGLNGIDSLRGHTCGFGVSGPLDDCFTDLIEDGF